LSSDKANAFTAGKVAFHFSEILAATGETSLSLHHSSADGHKQLKGLLNQPFYSA
jgi:hypothetical protein